MLATHSLVRRRGERTVLDGIEVTFAGGQLSAIVGPNGAGKTTLLRLLAGLDSPDRRRGGARRRAGSTASTLPRGPGASRICRRALPSTGPCWAAISSRWVACRTEPISAGRSRRPTPLPSNGPCARVGGTPLAARRIDELSQGERARLALARVLATEADVILADEPVANLDPAYALEAMTLLEAEAARGVCVVVCLHDLGLTARFADHIVLLAAGRMQASGTPAMVLQPGVIDLAYGVGFRMVTVDGIVQPIAWTYRRQNSSG